MRELGILGMNRRNHAFISRYNPRALFPIVDDKLKTKRLALDHNVQTPKLLGVVDSQHDVQKFQNLIEGANAFCIKPAKGSGGKGIFVVKDRKDGLFIRSNGEAVNAEYVKRQISNILSGLFSLGGALDVAMIEDLIRPSSDFDRFSFEGVPDIRVIVFRGVPVMAMMRLASRASNGKANLHQGAIGVGLDIASGQAVYAVQKGELVIEHPDTGAVLSELVVPFWDELLELACSCYEMCGLGYLGVDLVMDERFGPSLLELNARPGLSIQIANGRGLLPRLQAVEQIKHPDRMRIAEKIAFAKFRFGGQGPGAIAQSG